MSQILFVTGSDTGVGKTVVSVLLTRHWVAQGREVRAVKPFCSGGREDAEALREAQGGRISLDEVNPWHFRAPLTPLLAARRERRRIGLPETVVFLRQAARDTEILVVEGAGGLLSPLGVDFAADALIRELRALPVVVCPDRLGVLNQARLVVAALPPRQREAAQCVLVQTAQPDLASATNATLLAEFYGKRRIHRLPWLSVDARSAKAPMPPAIRRLARACLAA